ncbi:MAG: hypothetical protein M1828_007446 [Chrysothrix sp. TS-e1954]|nr:MAG: hypothetical protein M1828_007446 [Chrysothrix sp. TS-e1954]
MTQTNLESLAIQSDRPRKSRLQLQNVDNDRLLSLPAELRLQIVDEACNTTFFKYWKEESSMKIDFLALEQLVKSYTCAYDEVRVVCEVYEVLCGLQKVCFMQFTQDMFYRRQFGRFMDNLYLYKSDYGLTFMQEELLKLQEDSFLLAHRSSFVVRQQVDDLAVWVSERGNISIDEKTRQFDRTVFQGGRLPPSAILRPIPELIIQRLSKQGIPKLVIQRLKDAADKRGA